MREWTVTDIRWANARDMSLPLWKEASREVAGASPKWRSNWEAGYLAARLPKQAGAGDLYRGAVALERDADPLAALNDLIGSAQHRVAATIGIGEGRLTHERIRALEDFLGLTLPAIPADVLKSSDPVRVLGLTVDARSAPRSVAILIPHWESWEFLKPCVEAIDSYANPELRQRIYVLDDTSADGSFERAEQVFSGRADVELLRIERSNKAGVADVGALMDIALERVSEQYVAFIDADLYPLSSEWLAFPIWLIEHFGCSAAGLDTTLSSAYADGTRQQWWQPKNWYLPAAGLYDNEWFVCTNNLYRVMPTALAKLVSERIGFARLAPRGGPIANRLRRLVHSRSPYITGPADNGVAANHFIDVNRLGPKFNIPITSYVGITPTDGMFGQNISGLAFHFALSTRALSAERREVADPGSDYNAWAQRITQAGGFGATVLAEMIEATRAPKPNGYGRRISADWFQEQWDYIERLRSMFRSDWGLDG